MKKIFFVVFICLSFLCCKIDVKTPQKKSPARYELKTGPQVRAILAGLCADAVEAFLPSSERPPEGKTVYYLDIEEKNVMVWATDDWAKIYYYAEGVTTGDKNGKLVLNEDSSHFFEGCQRMQDIDVSKFDTSNVVNMSQMFNNCGYLGTFDLSNFNTSKVTDMSGMFASFKGRSINLSSFDTSNVTNMFCMFLQCEYLQTLDLSNFDTSKVSNMEAMFEGCWSITTIDLSSFDTSKVENMSRMFHYCNQLKKQDLSSFNTSKVKNMTSMFSDCWELTTIIVSENFDTSLLPPDGSPAAGKCMFYECRKLVGGNGTVYDNNHCDNTYARIDGGPDSSTPGYFTLKE